MAKKPFTEEYIRTASNNEGIYYLFECGVKIYIGSSEDSIRQRLREHKRGDKGPCTQNTHEFDERYSSFPKNEKRGELRNYYRINGRLPKCNDRIT